jgi:SAM-dependent methyltransferase
MISMDPASYDRWYETPRGRWIGLREAGLLFQALEPQPGESVLDVGCGTGYFTRTLATAVDGAVVGVDLNPEWIAYARRRDPGKVSYAVADAMRLPFADASFDLVVSITALCFIPDENTVARELIRVARRRFAIGLLNRRSLLWLRKGISGGSGGYRGAHWHTVAEVKLLFQGLGIRDLRVLTAIQVPNAGLLAQALERCWPPSLSTGAFILAVGNV